MARSLPLPLPLLLPDVRAAGASCWTGASGSGCANAVPASLASSCKRRRPEPGRLLRVGVRESLAARFSERGGGVRGIPPTYSRCREQSGYLLLTVPGRRISWHIWHHCQLCPAAALPLPSSPSSPSSPRLVTTQRRESARQRDRETERAAATALRAPPELRQQQQLSSSCLFTRCPCHSRHRPARPLKSNLRNSQHVQCHSAES